MEALKLSMEEILVKWATFCVDWFMNLFADPDYYWVEETYPSKKSECAVANIKKTDLTAKIVHAKKGVKEMIEQTVQPVIIRKKRFFSLAFALLAKRNMFDQRNVFKNLLRSFNTLLGFRDLIVKARLIRYSIINI
ncbi:hypothetical protein [Saccharicrinis fermentans]|uniref:Uncharacterized protein n=1 Tax=Saccharicrinis fermentans DSM 9555 = JCM 21142 TaxID=869213 RepID=W7Y312_9BACT|nr:hypothetical protein [Saccharicrinis fermentans]GAF02387.1 hypothetical protein JCM21142_31021 [Saccharicrinis fermentans DSM 9555 = JCM 21142]